MVANNSIEVKGWVERVLRDKDGNIKAQFADNKLWIFIKELTGLDLKIPFITGFWTLDPVKSNTIPTRGKRKIAELMVGVDVTPVTAIAIGVGTPSTTALGSESTTNGAARGAGSASNQTTDVTGDTAQLTKTFTFSGSFAITEEGLFDNNTSGGVMLASQSFSAVNVVSGDTLAFTHKVKVA